MQALPRVSTTGLTPEDVTELSQNIRKQMLDTFNEISLKKRIESETNGT